MKKMKILLTGLVLVSLLANVGFALAATIDWPLTFDGTSWVSYEDTIEWTVSNLDPTLTPIGGSSGGNLYMYTKTAITSSSFTAKLSYQPESETTAPFIEFKFNTPEDEVDDFTPEQDEPTTILLWFNDHSGNNVLNFKLNDRMVINGQTYNYDPINEDIDISHLWEDVGEENILYFGFRADGKIDVFFNGWLASTIDAEDFMGNGAEYGNVLSGTAHLQVISDNQGGTLYIPPPPVPQFIEYDPDYAVFTTFQQGSGYTYSVTPPTNVVASGPSVNEDDLFSLSGSFNDADGWETWTVEVDWDTTDGIPAESIPVTDFVLNGYETTGGLGTFALTHDYGGDGSYLGSLRVIDNEGGASDPVTFSAEVVEVPPTVEIDSATPTSNGDGTYSVDVEVSIDSLPDSVSSIVWYIDGVQDPSLEGEEDPTIDFADILPHTIKVIVTDSSGSTAEDEKVVEIEAPVVSLSGPTETGTMVPVTFTGTMDYGTYEIHSVEFNYGDGTVADGTFTGNSFEGTHTYTTGSGSPYTVTVTVTPVDPDTGTIGSVQGGATHSISVSAPAPDPIGISLSLPSPVDEMTLVTFDDSVLSVTGGAATLSYSWEISKDGVPVYTTTNSAFDYLFSVDGVYSIAVTVSDDYTSASETESITVNNIAPVVDLGEDIDGVFTGNSINFEASIVDNGKDLVSLLWEFGDGSTFNGLLDIWADPFGVPYTYDADASHTYVSAGVFTLRLTANDGTDETYDEITVTILPEIKPAIITADPATVPETGSAIFECSFIAPLGATYTVSWEVDDVEMESFVGVPGTPYQYEHQFGQNAIYEISFIISSSAVPDPKQKEIFFTVYNVAPTAEIDPVAPTNEGVPITFSAIVDDLGSDPVTYEWDFGDGSPVSTEVSPTHTYADNAAVGDYTVTLTVSDDLDSSDDTIQVSILNVAPVVTLDPFDSLVLPGVHTFTGSFIDTPEDYEFIAIWTIDGVAQPSVAISSGTTFAYDYDFTTGGVHTVDVQLFDKDGDYGTDSLSFIVNSPPEGTLSWAPQYPLSGEEVIFTLDAVDPDGDAFTATWDFGDGSPVESGLVLPHTYTTPGTYTVTITLTDPYESVTITAEIIVHSAPIISSVTPDPVIGRPGEETLFDLTAYDPDGGPLEYAWDFGDGDTEDVEDPSKAYAVSGTYTVTVIVTDEYGATAEYSFDYMVNALPVINEIEYTPEDPEPGVDIQFELDAFDPDGDALTYAWDFGDSTTSTEQNPIKAYAASGTYTVTITVTDIHDESVTDTVTVTVGSSEMSPYNMLLDAKQLLEDARDEYDEAKLDKIITSLEKALQDRNWVDEYHLSPQLGHRVFIFSRQAVWRAEAYAWRWEYDPDLDELVDILYEVVDLVTEANNALAEIALGEAGQEPSSVAYTPVKSWNNGYSDNDRNRNSRGGYSTISDLEKAQYWYNLGVKYQDRGYETLAISAFGVSWRYSQRVLSSSYYV